MLTSLFSLALLAGIAAPAPHSQTAEFFAAADLLFVGADDSLGVTIVAPRHGPWRYVDTEDVRYGTTLPEIGVWILPAEEEWLESEWMDSSGTTHRVHTNCGRRNDLQCAADHARRVRAAQANFPPVPPQPRTP